MEIIRPFEKLLNRLYLIISNVILDLLFFVEIFLFLRLILKYFNANPKALVVSIIYKYSRNLIYPFQFIFPNVSFLGKPVETQTLCAILGYAIFVYLVLKILAFFFKK
jgi:hypothetical protein